MDRFFALLALAGVVLYIRHLFRKGRQKNVIKEMHFKNFATKHGLHHRSEKDIVATLNMMHGEIEGLSVNFSEHMEGSGKSRFVMTTLTFKNSPVNFDFHIGRKSRVKKFAARKTMSPLEFEDRGLAKTFLVMGSDEMRITRLINPIMQEELAKLEPHLYGDINNIGNRLTYSFSGALLEQKHWDSFERTLCFILKLMRSRA